MIYHITTAAAWQAAQSAGTYTADSLAAQGFIHCSTAEQVARVANTVYTGQTGLVLLVIDPAQLHAALHVEPADSTIPVDHAAGEMFPHLYGPLNLDAVVDVLAFPPDADGVFRFPAG